jgi:NADH dehydrogenase
MYRYGKKRIIVLGAGFGGLRAARELAKSIKNLGLIDSYEVVLIDRHNYHTYTPTLYEAATTSKTTANYCDLKRIITFPIEEIIGGLPITFIHNTAKALDLYEGDVHLPGATLPFDYLVLAIGSETNYFNISGLQKYALTLKTFMDAMRIRDKIIEAFTGGAKELNIVIGGGGPTGVELSGELQHWLCELTEEYNSKCKAKVILVSGGSGILAGFDEKLINTAVGRLHQLGVEIINGEKVKEAKEKEIILDSGRKLPYDLLIWTGGVKASSLMATLPLKQSVPGKVEVIGGMECLPQTPDLKLYGKIYGLGDAICFFDPKTSRPVPLVARAAMLQADVIAKNIIADIQFNLGICKMRRRYRYEPQNYPYVTPVGGKFAIAKIGKFVFSGFPAWAFKGLIELNYLLSILSPLHAIKIWLKGLKIFIQNDRLG